MLKEDWKEIHQYSKEKDKNPRREYHFAVIERSTGNLIGAVLLALGGHEDKIGMIGYCYSRKAWGKGIGTEAASVLIEYGFGKLRLHMIWAHCDVENYASQRVLERNGMRREGCFKKKSFIKGEWRDDFHYAILKEEWEAKC